MCDPLVLAYTPSDMKSWIKPWKTQLNSTDVNWNIIVVELSYAVAVQRNLYTDLPVLDRGFCGNGARIMLTCGN